MNAELKIERYKTAGEADTAFASVLMQTDVVLDIGCGLRPFSLFRPLVHLAIEPWEQYFIYLQKRFYTEPGFIPLKVMAPDGLSMFPDKSVDTVLLLDVIEHMNKDVGRHALMEAERLARKQIAIFTPLGFIEQSYEVEEKDAWGLDNIELQTHKSGWKPEDLGENWEFIVCDSYHKHPKTGEIFGAFYAVKTFHEQKLPAFPQKTLIVSSYVLPPTPWENRTDQEKNVGNLLCETLQMIDPTSFSLIGAWDYAPYNSMIFFSHGGYAVHRLPVKYHFVSQLFDAGPETVGEKSFANIVNFDQIKGMAVDKAEQLYNEIILADGIENVIFLDGPKMGAYSLLYLEKKYGLNVRFVDTSAIFPGGGGLLEQAMREDGINIAGVDAAGLAKILLNL